MFTLLKLAIRNVLRNKSRTVFSLGSVAFGVLMSILLGGFIAGLQNVIVRDTVESKLGALQVHRKGYSNAKDSDPLNFVFTANPQLLEKILSVKNVTGATGRLSFQGLLSNGSTTGMVTVLAVEPEQQLTTLPIAYRDISGAPLSSQKQGGALLGVDLANALVTDEKSALILQAVATDGRQNALDIEMQGTFAAASAFESKRAVFMTLPYAQSLLNAPGKITELAIAIRDIKQVDEVAKNLKAVLGDEYEVETWRELRPMIKDVVNFQNAIFGAISLVFLAIAVFGVMNTMMMSVMERIREIGTMMAVGVKRQKITILFLFESIALGILGGLSGALLGIGAAHLMGMIGGIPVTIPGASSGRYIVPAVSSELIMRSVVSALIGATLAGAYPAWRASRLRPVDALRSV